MLVYQSVQQKTQFSCGGIGDVLGDLFCIFFLAEIFFHFWWEFLVEIRRCDLSIFQFYFISMLVISA